MNMTPGPFNSVDYTGLHASVFLSYLNQPARPEPCIAGGFEKTISTPQWDSFAPSMMS